MINLNKLCQTATFLGACYILMGCGGTPPQKDNTIRNDSQSITKTTTQQTQSPIDIIDEIEQNFVSSQNIQQRNAELLKLADSFIHSDSAIYSQSTTLNAELNNTPDQTYNCNSANQIVKHIQPSLQTQGHLSHANIIKAECQLIAIAELDTFANKTSLYELVDSWLKQSPVEPLNSTALTPVNKQSLYWRKTKAQITLFAMQDNYLSALQSLLNLLNTSQTDLLSAITSEQYKDNIWTWFSLLENASRTRIIQQFPVLSAYKLMLDTIEDSSLNDSMRQTTLVQWVNNNQFDPIAQNLPTQIQNYLQLNVDKSDVSEQKIAVLLPLSGRLAGQGEAIKQGMLAAYFNDLPAQSRFENIVTNAQQGKKYSKSIEFIDTGSLPTLSSQINTDMLQSYTTIVGPLLRSHIQQMSAFDLNDKKHLQLNQAQGDQSDPKQAKLYANFALAPEHEARQLVALMKKQAIQNPVLISDGTSITERMANAFIDAWQKTQSIKQGNVSTKRDVAVDTTANNLQHIKYTDNKNMRIGITSALDVLQSQRRISQLSNLSEERVYSVTRNRRDVDAFVVFARPDDVELINPIIESSISLFSSEQLPVFATSYSYNHKQSKNSLRDLKNLVFSDMPWLLPKQREASFSTTIDSLFNQPPSAYLRLFAFGYDALNIVDNLAQLQTFAHLEIEGLSGTLSINRQKVERELSSISITDEVIGAQ